LPSTTGCVRPPESDHHEIRELVASPPARRVVVVYTWNFHPDLIASARQHGAHGYLSKTLPARELVAALEAVYDGEVVISDVPPRGRSAVGLDWPGRGEGLSDRESEILALITQGKSNAEVAKLTYLSPQHREVLHSHDLPQNRRPQPNPSCPMGGQARLHSRPQPHRTLARRPLSCDISTDDT
jgi:FixJ family two-component response regulator